MSQIIESLKSFRKPLNLEFLRKTHVHYATPCYGGNISEPFFRSWSRAHMIYTKHDIPYSLTTAANESLITRARCHMVAYFMANPKATHLMFIDADINFDPVDVLHMIQHDKDIIVGAYPKKEIDWKSVKDSVETGIDISNISENAASYALNFDWKLDEENNRKTLKIENGLVKLKDGATGFMLIKRAVFERMIAAYPELYFKNDLNLPEEESKFTYLFFDCMHEQETKRYLSEDYAFCRRWQQLGGEVWLDPIVKLDHIGHYHFKGNVGKMFYSLDSTNNKI